MANNSATGLFAPIEVTLSGATKFPSKDTGETMYFARAEIPTPGLAWSTCRVKVVSTTPLADGPCKLQIKDFNEAKGVAAGRVVS